MEALVQNWTPNDIADAVLKIGTSVIVLCCVTYLLAKFLDVVKAIWGKK